MWDLLGSLFYEGLRAALILYLACSELARRHPFLLAAAAGGAAPAAFLLANLAAWRISKRIERDRFALLATVRTVVVSEFWGVASLFFFFSLF